MRSRRKYKTWLFRSSCRKRGGGWEAGRLGARTPASNTSEREAFFCVSAHRRPCTHTQPVPGTAALSAGRRGPRTPKSASESINGKHTLEERPCAHFGYKRTHSISLLRRRKGSVAPKEEGGASRTHLLAAIPSTEGRAAPLAVKDGPPPGPQNRSVRAAVSGTRA